MIIRGWQRTSLVDYPGRIVSTLFLAGCNFRCPYCQNPDLVEAAPGGGPEIETAAVLAHLERRRGLIDGICVSGGEPLLNPDLAELLEPVKALGGLVKIDTNGSRPATLEALLHRGLVDYVAMDVKAPPWKIPAIARRDVDLSTIERSLALLRTGSVDYELRTTVVPGLLDPDDVVEIFRWIRGAPRHYLQQFRPTAILDPTLQETEPYPAE